MMVKVVWVRDRWMEDELVLCDKIWNFLSRDELLTNNALSLVSRSWYRFFEFQYPDIVTEFCDIT